MKLINLLSICILSVLVLTVLAVAAPPSLSNHQFYGDVFWNGTVLKQQIKAVVNNVEYTSRVEGATCIANNCSGKYGIAQDNILRVQGSNGNLVTFYVDGVKINTYIYAADASTQLTLDFLNIPPEPVAACEPDWDNCTFLECVDKLKQRTCIDLNACNATVLTRVDNISCIGGTTTVNNVTNATTNATTITNDVTITITNCEYQWQCTGYSSCVSGLKSRTCSRVDTCDLQYTASPATINVVTKPQPAETESCVVPKEPDSQPPIELPTCSDNIKNQNEEDVDCGGVCPACSTGIPWMYWGIPLIVLVLIGLGVGSYLLFTHAGAPPLSPQQQQQLTNYFRAGMARGMAKEQIEGNLIKSGWKSSVVKKYSKGL